MLTHQQESSHNYSTLGFIFHFAKSYCDLLRGPNSTIDFLLLFCDYFIEFYELSKLKNVQISK